MKKIFVLGLITLALFALFYNVHAENPNNQNNCQHLENGVDMCVQGDTANPEPEPNTPNNCLDPGTGIDMCAQGEPTESGDQNLEIGKFGLTQFAMKIKLIHLINTIDLKVAQAQHVVDTINDTNDSNVTIDVAPITTEITNLGDIKTRIQNALDDENLTKEQILEVFLTEKENAKTAIKNIRDYIRENCPIEMRNEFKTRFQAQKKELKPEFQQRVKELRNQHNEFVKGEFREILGLTKKEIKEGPPKADTVEPEELENEFKEKIKEKQRQRQINEELIENRVKGKGGNN